MSLFQIFSRLGRLSRSYSDDDDRVDSDDLRRAEELIAAENDRWELPEPPAAPEPAKDAAPSEQPGAPAAPAVMTIERAYTVLGLTSGSAIEEVTRAYRKAILQHHPDRAAARGADEQRRAELLAQELNRAYALLKDHLAR